jgi:hypothetical protein
MFQGLAVSIVRVLMSYEDPDDGDTFSLWNVAVLEPPDASLSPRIFY